MTGMHLPHPHLADRFIEGVGEGFWDGLFHHRNHHDPPSPQRSGLPAEDWDDWHWPCGSGYVDDGRNER